MIKESSKYKTYFFIALMLGVCLLLSACDGISSRESSSQFEPTMANCWVCTIYGIAFTIAEELVNKGVTAGISIARTILGIGMAFFLLFRIGSMMFFASEKDVDKTMKDIGFTALKAVLVGVLIGNVDIFRYFIHNAVVYPIGQFLLLISNAVLSTVPESGKYFGGISGVEPFGIKDHGNIVPRFVGQDFNFDVAKSIFGDLGLQVQYTVARIYATLNAGFIFVNHMFVLGGFFAMLLGAVMWWQLLNLVIIFPFAFADGFLWLAFYIVFTPLLLTLWVFPATKGYLNKVFPSQFLSPFLNVLFGCIVAVIMVTLLQLYSDLMLNGIFRTTAQQSNTYVSESASKGSPNIIILAMLCIIVRKIAMEIGEFTEKFGGESNESSFFKLIQKTFDMAKKVAVTAAIAIVSGVATGGAGAVQAVGQEAMKAAAKQAANAGAKAAAGKTFGGEKDKGEGKDEK